MILMFSLADARPCQVLHNLLGFRVRVLGVLGFRILGFRVVGFRV